MASTRPSLAAGGSWPAHPNPFCATLRRRRRLRTCAARWGRSRRSLRDYYRDGTRTAAACQVDERRKTNDEGRARFFVLRLSSVVIRSSNAMSKISVTIDGIAYDVDLDMP